MAELIDDPIVLTKKLIGFRSITPDDAGSLEFISSFIEQLGFQTIFLLLNFFLSRLKNV